MIYDGAGERERGESQKSTLEFHWQKKKNPRPTLLTTLFTTLNTVKLYLYSFYVKRKRKPHNLNHPPLRSFSHSLHFSLRLTFPFTRCDTLLPLFPFNLSLLL